MLLVNNLVLQPIKSVELRKKKCFFCDSRIGRLKRIISNNGKRTDFCCFPCFKQIGHAKALSIFEDLPLKPDFINELKNRFKGAKR